MTLTQINLYRMYHEAEKIHYNFIKSGYNSIAHKISDLMCDIEDTWIADGLNIGDLIYTDPDEQLVNDIEAMTDADKTDYLHYLQGYSEIG